VAALVNMVITFVCTGCVGLLQAYYKYRGTEPPNPLVLLVIFNSFVILSLLQVREHIL
jgi:hypothetical protein